MSEKVANIISTRKSNKAIENLSGEKLSKSTFFEKLQIFDEMDVMSGISGMLSQEFLRI